MKKQIHLNLWQKSSRPCWLPVTSESMKATLAPGMRILVNPKKRVRMGSIFMFRYGDLLIIHRAIFIRKDWIYEKGDNARAIHRIRTDDALGVVIAIRKVNGEVVKLNSWHKIFGLIRAFMACFVTCLSNDYAT